jgi:hypothetical protein
MGEKWTPPQPKFCDRCVICGEKIEGQGFIASKPRRKGSTIYAHTRCFEEEQKGAKP